MKIEAGKRYVRRDETITRPVRKDGEWFIIDPYEDNDSRLVGNVMIAGFIILAAIAFFTL